MTKYEIDLQRLPALSAEYVLSARPARGRTCGTAALSF